MPPKRPAGADPFAQRFNALLDNIEPIIRGKSDVLKRALVCFFAEGHLLIEDVPGVGKTSRSHGLSWHPSTVPEPGSVHTRSTSLGCHGRVHLQPDRQGLEFYPGPVFANIVVGDEINRASPKTQSALLEVMEERRVTVDGVAHSVLTIYGRRDPKPNRNGMAPTGCPEAQLDRFLMRIGVGYPDLASEMEVIDSLGTGSTVDSLQPVLTAADVGTMIDAAPAIHVALRSCGTGRGCISNEDAADIRLGASPRGGIALRSRGPCPGSVRRARFHPPR